MTGQCRHPNTRPMRFLGPILVCPDCGCIHPSREEDSRPTVVCLCGSTRFSAAFREATLRETLTGNIVLSVGCDMRGDDDIFGHMTEEEKAATKDALDELHMRKIDLADEVLILNCGGYVGASTARELAYARAQGKRVRFLEERHAPVLP